MNCKTVFAAGVLLMFAGILFAQATPDATAEQAKPPGRHLNID